MALAEFDAEKQHLKAVKKKPNVSRKSPVMEANHFHTVAQASVEFDDYLVGTLHGADDELALRDKMRGAAVDPEHVEKKLKKPGKSRKRDTSESESDDEQ